MGQQPILLDVEREYFGEVFKTAATFVQRNVLGRTKLQFFFGLSEFFSDFQRRIFDRVVKLRSTCPEKHLGENIFFLNELS